MAKLTIDEIIPIDDAIRELVIVPEWRDAEINVCSMSAFERADVEKTWGTKQVTSDPAAFRADVLQRSLKNDDGTPFATQEQVQLLMKKNAAPIERLFEAACRVNAFTRKDIEDLEKN